jgi:exopolysaccharide biosynthesis polyprenyl glycosylphosphotransferase
MTRWLTAERAQKLNVLGDCILLAAASFVATMTNESPTVKPGVASGLAFSLIFVWAVAGRVVRHYDMANGRRERGDFVMTMVLVAFTIGTMAALGALVPQCRHNVEVWRFALVLVPGVVWLRLMTSWLRMRREVQPARVLVMGTGSLGRLTGHELRSTTPVAREVLGYLRFDDEAAENARLPAPVIGVAEELEAVIKSRELDEVYIAAHITTHHKQMQKAITTCERYGIPFALPAAGFRFDRAVAVGGTRATPDGYVHYLSVQPKPIQWAVKRLFDIFASGTALLLLSPLLIGTALAVKLTSKGPVLFKQTRVGLYGRQFHMLKFRSMVVNAEELRAKLAAQNEQTGPVFKLKRDPRITAVGRFIRKFSVDELPQLINVLRGEMSVVGPRPAIPSEVAQYEAWQRRRLSVRPGLTCVWQVSGRNEIGFEDWMYLDMQYIDHWSLAQDFALVLRTVPVVLTGRGAS